MEATGKNMETTGKNNNLSLIKGCNGDTYDNCVRNNGESWCSQNCVNADSTSTCNGDAYVNSYRINGLEWSKKYCKDSKGKLYNLTRPNKLLENFNDTCINTNNFTYLIIFIIIIIIIYLSYRKQ